MIKVGIIGTGKTFGIADYHAMGLVHDGRAKIAAVYNSTKESGLKWVARHGFDAKVCSSSQELLDIVDAVCICTPNAYHYQYAKEAIENSKDILIEKPLALTTEQCNELALLANGYPKVNMIGFVNRYAKAVQKARSIVQERLGKVFTVTAWYGGKRLSDPCLPIEWRMIKSQAGTGALGDFGSHLIDLAYFIADQRYSEISCITSTNIPYRAGEKIENDDSAMFIAKSNNGIGSFTVSRTGLDDIMILISGEGGLIQVSLRKPTSVVFWEKSIDGGYTGKIENYSFPEHMALDSWFDSQMTAFLDAVERKSLDYPDIQQGLYVQGVLEAAEISSDSHKEVSVK